MSEHWESRHCYHEGTYTKVFVSVTKLSKSSFFVRVIHKVYVTLKNLRIKGDCIFYCVAVFLVFLFFEHVHECRVINTVHTQSSYKETFHHPESFCKKKGIRNFLGNAVYNFAPEFIWNCVVELLSAEPCFRTGCDVSSVTRLRIPEAADRFFCKNHCRVKADNREVTCNV